MTNEIVQIRPCVQLCGQVAQCTTEEADFFSVYYGAPVRMTWSADFASFDDAYNWAEEMAENNECPLDVSHCATEEA